MPCRDDGYGDGGVSQRLDLATRVACTVLKALQNSGEAEDAECTQDFWERLLEDQEVAVWWAIHKKEDSDKEARAKEKAVEEARRQAVLARLTPEEREILQRGGLR